MNVLDYFSSYENLPVTLDDVRAFVLERTHFATIEFFPISFSTEKLLGVCWQFIDEPRNSLNSHRRAWVLYSDSLTPEMARVVICKEILHLLDPQQEHAGNPEQVGVLIDEIVQPVEIKAALHTLSDQNGLLLALAVLMPFGAIDLFREKVESGAVSFETLSKLSGVPEHFVRAAFGKHWAPVIEMLNARYSLANSEDDESAAAAE